MTEQIDLAEFLLIAERVLGIDAKRLKSAAKLNSAESALCSRVIRNHPLPDGNKRTGYLCMLIQLDRAGLVFEHPSGGQDETADVIEALAAGELSEEKFVAWVATQTRGS